MVTFVCRSGALPVIGAVRQPTPKIPRESNRSRTPEAWADIQPRCRYAVNSTAAAMFKMTKGAFPSDCDRSILNPTIDACLVGFSSLNRPSGENPPMGKGSVGVSALGRRRASAQGLAVMMRQPWDSMVVAVLRDQSIDPLGYQGFMRACSKRSSCWW